MNDYFSTKKRGDFAGLQLRITGDISTRRGVRIPPPALSWEKWDRMCPLGYKFFHHVLLFKNDFLKSYILHMRISYC
jgi:hypothetical protein